MTTSTPPILLALFALLASAAMAGNVLFSGGRLFSGESLTYKNYSLVMQQDCDLVAYASGNRTWASGSAGRGRDCYLTLESDGELVIFGVDASHPFGTHVIWRSGSTSKQGSYALVLRHNGDPRVHGPMIWSVPGKGVDSPSAVDSNWPATTDAVLWSGDVAPIGTTIVNSPYALVLEEKCNLTLSDTSTSVTLWQTGTYDSLRDCFVTLESNGELVIKYMGGAPLWGSNVKSVAGEYVLVLKTDGQLNIYGPVVWSASGAVDIAVSLDATVSGEEKIATVSGEEKIATV